MNGLKLFFQGHNEGASEEQQDENTEKPYGCSHGEKKPYVLEGSEYPCRKLTDEALSTHYGLHNTFLN